MRFSAGLARTRLASGILLTAVVLLLLLANPWTPQARAQEGEAEAPKTTTPAEAPPETGMVAHMLESVGWGFGILLGFVSVTLIAIIVLLAMELRMGVAIPP